MCTKIIFALTEYEAERKATDQMIKCNVKGRPCSDASVEHLTDMDQHEQH